MAVKVPKEKNENVVTTSNRLLKPYLVFYIYVKEPFLPQSVFGKFYYGVENLKLLVC